MRIEVLFFQGCPNREDTVRLVNDVAGGLGLEAEVNEVEVASSKDAERLRFLGSPTVRVNGEDVEPARRAETSYAMACRRYEGSGVPPRSMIEDALARFLP